MKYTKTTLPILSVIAAGASLTALTACSDNQRANITTPETAKTQSAVQAYDSAGTQDTKLKAERAFAQLDEEIRELEVRVQATTGEKQAEAKYKLDQLKKRESELRGDFNEAKFNTLLKDVKDSVR